MAEKQNKGKRLDKNRLKLRKGESQRKNGSLRFSVDNTRCYSRTSVVIHSGILLLPVFVKWDLTLRLFRMY